MNPGLTKLHPYPFEKLARLFDGVSPLIENTPIDLSIGEPKHETPEFILDEIRKHLHEASHYPKTRGSSELRETIASWLIRRFHLPLGSVDPDKHVLPVNGTREALFAFAQCIIDHNATSPKIISPNPFYQIYEGAAFLAGAEPFYVNCTESKGFRPDFSSVTDKTWDDCQLIYLCSPNNPTGAVLDKEILSNLLELSDQHDFVIAADECYSEIYFEEDQPSLGLLQACAELGRDDYRRCVVFHSLSKRSNVPGMRSGFVAGDKELIQKFLSYRTYHGCAMAPYTQAASCAAWQDENHVVRNRDLYREKFAVVLKLLKPILNVSRPEGGFYLWPETPIDDQEFSRGLYTRQNVTVLPGSFLSRKVNGINPGEMRVRIALVAPVQECIDAAERLRDHISNL